MAQPHQEKNTLRHRKRALRSIFSNGNLHFTPIFRHLTRTPSSYFPHIRSPIIIINNNNIIIPTTSNHLLKMSSLKAGGWPGRTSRNVALCGDCACRMRKTAGRAKSDLCARDRLRTYDVGSFFGKNLCREKQRIIHCIKR